MLGCQPCQGKLCQLAALHLEAGRRQRCCCARRGFTMVMETDFVRSDRISRW